MNEIATAEEHVIEITKLFPSETSGGPDFVKAIRAPCPWTSMMPTGGVNPDEDSLRIWFDMGVVCVGMGSRLVRKDWVQSGAYPAMSNTTRTALDLIKSIRTGSS